MRTLPEAMHEYKKQLELGAIQQAYQGLMEYMLALRTHFQNQNPDLLVSGSLYFGYMDMTYFAISSKALKDRQLKIAIVFLHDKFRFEVWLAGMNKRVQARYWQMFKESGWEKYPLVPTIQGADSILEHILVAEPDFSDLQALTQQIEAGTVKFIEAVEAFLCE